MSDYLYAFSLFIIAVICLLAVFHSAFKENFGQLAGLSIICIAASVRLFEVLTHASITSQSSARWALTHGLAVYAVSTVYKYWQMTRKRGKHGTT